MKKLFKLFSVAMLALVVFSSLSYADVSVSNDGTKIGGEATSLNFTNGPTVTGSYSDKTVDFATLAGAKTFSGAVTMSSTLAVTGAQTLTGATYANGGLDRSTAAALAIGATNATSVVVTPATTVTGALYPNGGLDRSTAAALAIGATNATSVTITPATTISGAATLSSTAKIVGNATIQGALNFAADAGANDTYAITLAPAPAAYTTGMYIAFTANTANTGACSINVNSLGAKALKKGVSTDPGDNFIKSGSVVVAIYDGTNFQMLQPAAQ